MLWVPGGIQDDYRVCQVAERKEFQTPGIEARSVTMTRQFFSRKRSQPVDQLELV
jgi:hypothetical protein